MTCSWPVLRRPLLSERGTSTKLISVRFLALDFSVTCLAQLCWAAWEIELVAKKSSLVELCGSAFSHLQPLRPRQSQDYSHCASLQVLVSEPQSRPHSHSRWSTRPRDVELRRLAYFLSATTLALHSPDLLLRGSFRPLDGPASFMSVESRR